MKVLHVITRCDLGGAQTVMRTLAEGQVALGHEVRVVCGESGPTGDVLQRNGIEVVVAPELRHGFARPGDVMAVRAIRRLLRLTRPDVVHSHSSKAGLVARMATRVEGLPSVYTAHGWPFQAGAPAAQRVASYVGEAAASRLGTVVICVSEAEARLARRARAVPASRLVVIPNGIDDRSPALADRTDGPIVMVARFAMPKRHDVLLEAVARFGARAPALTLIGSGPRQGAARRQVDELGLRDVTFAGDRDDVAELLDRAAIAVLLSDYEGQPISLIEAMRSGAPIVATDLAGTRELLADGAGLLVPNQPREVADALARLLASADRRQAMAARARQVFEARHRATTMVDAVVRVYDEVVAGAAARRRRAR